MEPFRGFSSSEPPYTRTGAVRKDSAPIQRRGCGSNSEARRARLSIVDSYLRTAMDKLQMMKETCYVCGVPQVTKIVANG